MLQKKLVTAALCALFLPVAGIAAYEDGAPPMLRPSTAETVRLSPTSDNGVQLVRGYGWKRARKKSKTKTSGKKADLRSTETQVAIAQTNAESLVRGYGWKRARKKMVA
ncbi:MAG: hypothetical protein AB7P69_28280 [Candidatus Binatia bacterium]